MLNILFDHQTFSLQQYGGISRYFANLYHGIKDLDNINSNISILYTNNNYIQDVPGLLNKNIGQLLFSKQKKMYKWNRNYSKYIIKNNKFDVLHPTYYDPYFLEELKKPFVITVHDMIHENFPEYFSPNDDSAYHKRLCIEKANHIIAISEATKRDIQYHLNIPDEKISVIHHGFMQLVQHEAIASAKNQNYLLYVGDRASYKNFSRLIRAITPILNKQPHMRLICAGGGSFQSAEKELILRLNIEEQIAHRIVSDLELADLYKNAIAFIYPSLYEGFGLPLLEAFQHRCPVVASDIPCFREVGGDALSYFDPYDEDHIRTMIEAVINNEDLKTRLIEAGQEKLLNFSMRNCFEKTMNVYKNISQTI